MQARAWAGIAVGWVRMVGCSENPAASRPELTRRDPEPAGPNCAHGGGRRNLTAVNADLTITDNPAMTSLAGLDALTSVLGNVRVTGNDGIPPDEVAAFVARLSHPVLVGSSAAPASARP